MFLFIWLEKYIRGGTTEETLEKLRKKRAKEKGLQYTQKPYRVTSQINENKEQDNDIEYTNQ